MVAEDFTVEVAFTEAVDFMEGEASMLAAGFMGEVVSTAAEVFTVVADSEAAAGSAVVALFVERVFEEETSGAASGVMDSAVAGDVAEAGADAVGVGEEGAETGIGMIGVGAGA